VNANWMCYFVPSRYIVTLEIFFFYLIMSKPFIPKLIDMTSPLLVVTKLS
jgi:hypothetical protein